jgi:hypothetical protein
MRVKNSRSITSSAEGLPFESLGCEREKTVLPMAGPTR